ncbi:MAG: Rho termination factor N-terminal domain-containing protein [Nostocaceae cyanobacterium]|nr:Rho termination factor N-terminal domain-containing protein [Nostocaceae cyanobacterium]
MSNLSNIGNLMYLYINEIKPSEGTDAPDFLITAAAKKLNSLGGRNWVPIIVKEVAEDKYEVIGNSFVYAVAKEADLEKVWCIIADSSNETADLSKVLSGESMPKINLSTATKDEIKAALLYLREKPGSVCKSINILFATNRIDEAPRQYWKNLDQITTLKCGITKGVKLDALKEVFYLTPQPMPEIIRDPMVLKTLNVAELKAMAKKREISDYSKKKKNELVELLSQ